MSDLALVAWLFAPLFVGLAWSALFVLVAHQAVSFAGAALGMRASAR